MSRKKTHGKARRVDFSSIGAGEIVRWNLGMPIIAGEFAPAKHAAGVAPTPWPSWKAWAATYGAVRDEYLASYHDRHRPDEVPGAELLFAAYERGENPGDVEVPRPPDPRYLLHGIG